MQESANQPETETAEEEFVDLLLILHLTEHLAIGVLE